jgi:imidazolonepropionase-like amidohydrolase
MTRPAITLLVAIVSAVGGPPLGSQTSSSPGTTAVHAQQPRRLLVRDVMVVYGTGKPPFGPMDVLVEDGLIAEVRSSAGNSRNTADAVIDGRGKYLLPGFVNTHMHWHEERMPGVPQPIQY